MGCGCRSSSRRSCRSRDPQRGDVVVFRYPLNPSQDFIKRVVGLGGDTVVYQNKQLTVNGMPLAAASRTAPTAISRACGSRRWSSSAKPCRDGDGDEANTRSPSIRRLPAVSPRPGAAIRRARELRLQSRRQRIHLQGAGGAILHDGRQPRPQRRQPVLGIRARRPHARHARSSSGSTGTTSRASRSSGSAAAFDREAAMHDANAAARIVDAGIPVRRGGRRRRA